MSEGVILNKRSLYLLLSLYFILGYFPFQRGLEDQNFNVLRCAYTANNAIATFDLWVLTQNHVILLATDYVKSQNCP